MKKAVSQALANDIWYFFQNSGNREVSKTCKPANKAKSTAQCTAF